MILVSGGGVAGVTGAVHPKRPAFVEPPTDPNQVNLAQVQHWARTVLWVDARPDAEFASGHIPEAVSLNFENWPEQFPKFLDQYSPDRRGVLYCSATSCQRSREMADKLVDSGITADYFLV